MAGPPGTNDGVAPVFRVKASYWLELSATCSRLAFIVGLNGDCCARPTLKEEVAGLRETVIPSFIIAIRAFGLAGLARGRPL
jgi:hypothetical protein